MTRRFISAGQNPGDADTHMRAQHMRRDDGCRFEPSDGTSRWPTILAIVVMFAMLVIVTNGDLILLTLGE